MISRPASFLVKQHEKRPWIFPCGIVEPQSLQIEIIGVAGSKSPPTQIKDANFNLTWSGQDALITTKDIYLLGNSPDQRLELYTAYQRLLQKLDTLEASNFIKPGGTRIISLHVAKHLPLPLDETSLYAFGMVNSGVDFLKSKHTYIDLSPGLRLKVNHGGFYDEPVPGPGSQTLSAYGGTGVEYIHISSVPHSSVLSYNAFLEGQQLNITSLDKRHNRVAASVIDLCDVDERKPYHRLFYPHGKHKFSPVDEPDDTLSVNSAIVRASSQKEMTDLTKNFPDAAEGHGVVFSGRSLIVPELNFHVNGIEVHAPVGTTLRNMVEKEINTFQRPRQLKFYREIGGYSTAVNFEDDLIGFDLALQPGDRLKW